MPAPTRTVTFIDKDGDEFPIRVASGGDETDGKIMERAYRVLKLHIDNGDLSPTLPFESTEIDVDTLTSS